jgi:hypothetical protein
MTETDPHQQPADVTWTTSLKDAVHLLAGLSFTVAGHTSHRLASVFLSRL